MNIPERPLNPPEPPEPKKITRCSSCVDIITSADELYIITVNDHKFELCEDCIRRARIIGENYINDEMNPPEEEIDD